MHEFLDGHSCPNLSGGSTYRQLVPLDASSAALWGPSPTSSTSDLLLAAVNSEFVATEGL